MAIEKALARAMEAEVAQGQMFKRQIERYRTVKRRMDEAGVVPNKQEFTIPLIERIGTVNIHDD